MFDLFTAAFVAVFLACSSFGLSLAIRRSSTTEGSAELKGSRLGMTWVFRGLPAIFVGVFILLVIAVNLII